MHHGVDSFEIRGHDVADVAVDFRSGRYGQWLEVTAVVERRVEPDHVVAGRLEDAPCD
jgi:hypothetical protein